ncbi:unnamed protein product, partial [Urochloa humidicola]
TSWNNRGVDLPQIKRLERRHRTRRQHPINTGTSPFAIVNRQKIIAEPCGPRISSAQDPFWCQKRRSANSGASRPFYYLRCDLTQKHRVNISTPRSTPQRPPRLTLSITWTPLSLLSRSLTQSPPRFVPLPSRSESSSTSSPPEPFPPDAIKVRLLAESPAHGDCVSSLIEDGAPCPSRHSHRQIAPDPLASRLGLQPDRGLPAFKFFDGASRTHHLHCLPIPARLVLLHGMSGTFTEQVLPAYVTIWLEEIKVQQDVKVLPAYVTIWLEEIKVS